MAVPEPGPDPNKARAAYQWIVAQHPQHPVAPWAALALAQMPELNVLHPAPAAAVPLYQKVMADYPASPAAHEAALHLAVALFAARGTSDAAAAVVMLENQLRSQPPAPYAAEIELLLGKLERYPLADYRAAVTHLRRALDLGLATLTQQAKTCWTIAELADEELHDRDLAVAYYTRFLQEYPRDTAQFQAKLALRRLGAPWPAAETPGRAFHEGAPRHCDLVAGIRRGAGTRGVLAVACSCDGTDGHQDGALAVGNQHPRSPG